MNHFLLPIATLLLSLACYPAAIFASEANAPQANTDQHAHDKQDAHSDHDESSEQAIRLDAKAAQQAGLQTALLEAGVITDSEPVFGVIAAIPSRFYRIEAPFDGLVSALLVQQGQQVKAGQPLVKVTNSATLQSYTVSAPASGEVLSTLVNAGEKTNGRPLLELADLSEVQVELSVFPSVLAKLKPGAEVLVRDLHTGQDERDQDERDQQHEGEQHQGEQHESDAGGTHDHLANSPKSERQHRSRISYIAPQMTEGHIARARATLQNPVGDSSHLWRPGMHVQAELVIQSRSVPLRVRREALQQLDGQTVVFVEQTQAPANNVAPQHGEHNDDDHDTDDHKTDGHSAAERNTPAKTSSTAAAIRVFWPIPVQVEQQDSQYAAVRPLESSELNRLGDNPAQPQLQAGSRYVTRQSFLLKAELGKAAANHQH